METWAIIAGAAFLLGLGVFGLHQAAIWADRRGLLYYRTKPRFRGSSLGLLEEIYHPATSHVIDEQQREPSAADKDESGDTPEAGSPG